MECLKVKIQSLEDLANGIMIIEDNDLAELEETKDFTIGILEKGTVGGQTTLMFILKCKDGSVKAAQCTARQFEMLASTFRGAEQRFGNKKQESI